MKLSPTAFAVQIFVSGRQIVPRVILLQLRQKIQNPFCNVVFIARFAPFLGWYWCRGSWITINLIFEAIHTVASMQLWKLLQHCCVIIAHYWLWPLCVMAELTGPVGLLMDFNILGLLHHLVLCWVSIVVFIAGIDAVLLRNGENGRMIYCGGVKCLLTGAVGIDCQNATVTSLIYYSFTKLPRASMLREYRWSRCAFVTSMWHWRPRIAVERSFLRQHFHHQYLQLSQLCL